ncbi:glycoside hydrolase family 13 protein [Ectobacillus ponti]|uniref:Alpha-amylase n=1 Tax=Ectobacillus ponti TaxID=2961894 RepID=A0AA41XA80_9BACI|nr:alpha-glucosidase [Ectobacillus ponti]MCP8969180.1 alpha-glucosidase [Ectobacillus ponti]
MKKIWWKEATAYQIYPRSFMDSDGDGMGDLRGIISKLDYLKDLGIDVIWICPFYKSPNDDNGYDISDYHEVMDVFGTMADFDELLAEVHGRGMKLIIDLVINHTSDEHPWFVESRSSKDHPRRDWYMWADPKEGAEPNNWESIFGGSAWEYDEETGQYFLHVFSRRQPDLNWENPDVRSALHDMINWWLDKGIDGFRVDAISHIKKKPGLPDLPNPQGLDYVPSFEAHMNQEGIHAFLEELNAQTFAKYDIMTVGEANGVTTEDAHLWVGEEKGKFNMVFQFEHLDLWDKSKPNEIDVVSLKTTLSKWQKGLEKDGWNALFIENHDKARVVSTWGNDREYRVESAKAFGMMYFLMQGTPFLYQGQEIGMTNVHFQTIEEYDDVAIKNMYRLEREKGVSHEEIMEIIWATGRDNSRTPMQWNDQPNAGFTTGMPWIGVNENYVDINVEKDLQNLDSILNFYKRMIQLRKENELFVYGQYDLILPKDEQIYAYTRTLGHQTAVVMCNLTSKPAAYAHEGHMLSAGQVVLSNYEVPEHEAATAFTLRPYESRVYML